MVNMNDSVAGETDIFAKAAADSAAGAPFNPGESVAGVGSSSSSSSGAVASSGQKICCVCGIELKGKTRFKDGEGKYWCYECGMADSMRKHPVPCPDCKRNFPHTELTEFKGVHLCAECLAKRQQAFKREQARIARAEEEARQEELKRLRVKIVIWVLGGLLALYGLYAILSNLF